MFQRSQIEQLLQINGIPTNSEDEEIKSVLLSARWHEDDVDAAILVLRENKTNQQTHVDTIHKVFHSDENLRPETISSLLGIDMDITAADLPRGGAKRTRAVSFNTIFTLGLTSLLMSLVFVFAAMWYLKMGLFYDVGSFRYVP